jgi:predicted TIM-barrel fold metal-dependent hydrolase
VAEARAGACSVPLMIDAHHHLWDLAAREHRWLLGGQPWATGADRASGLRPYYEAVLAAFGPDRLLFGSDWPVCTLAAPHGQVCALYRELTAQLSAAEQDAIFGHTARRVYRLR